MATLKKTNQRPELAHWVDQSVPDLRTLLNDRIDVSAFTAWLGPVVGRYRSEDHIAHAVPSVTEIANELGRLSTAAQTTLQAVRHLSPHARAGLLTLASRADKSDVAGILPRLLRDLAILQSCADAARKPIADASGKRGAKPKAPRDRLLAQVSEQLMLMGIGTKAEARSTAAEVLNRCRVLTPADERNRRRAEKAGSPQGKNSAIG